MINTATFGAGCFWGVEKAFRRKYGPFIHSIFVGYAGGQAENPNYRAVCSGQTGHAEAVQIVYDGSKVSFADLVDFFYRMHEPHTTNRQGNDVGSQYRSVIFYHDEEQKKTAESVTAVAQKYYGKVKISTTIEPVGTFYKAEDYHQDYLTQNPHGYECATHFERELSTGAFLMSELQLMSDISKIQEVLSKVDATEKALKELTCSGVHGVSYKDKMNKLQEFLREAKDTLQEAAAGYDAQDSQVFSSLFNASSSQPPLRPYVQKVTEKISHFSKRFKIVENVYAQLSSVFYSDIVVLYLLTIMWNWMIPLPRLEWLVFMGLSIGSFFRVFHHSKAIFSNSLVLIIAATLKLSDLQHKNYFTIWVDIDFITVLNSIIMYQISIQDLRGDDPKAQAYWVTFVISDILFKSAPNTLIESLVCSYTLAYSFMMIWVRANSMAIQKKAAGVPEYDVEGKLERSWNGSEIFYSNQFSQSDRFELNIRKLSNDEVVFSYVIPRALAKSLCTEKDYKKVYHFQPKNSYNITALLDDFPAHYVLRQNFVVMVNNQKYEKFKLSTRHGTLWIGGLEHGKSYKVTVMIEGYQSVPCRIRTASTSGTWMHVNFIDRWNNLKYVNAEICAKSVHANSRPVSSLSFLDLNRDISFNFDEGLEIAPLETTDSLKEGSILPDSSKSGKFSEMELNDHIVKMISREKDSLKAIENKISKVKADTAKEYAFLQKSLEGIKKLNNKAEAKNERYRSKCNLYKDIIKETKDGLPNLRNQITASTIHYTKLDDEKTKLDRDIDSLQSKKKDLQNSLESISETQKIELEALAFENEELSNIIKTLRSNLALIFQAIQKLSDPTYPTGIHAMSAQLEVYEARYQRQLETNPKGTICSSPESQPGIRQSHIWKSVSSISKEDSILIS